MNHMPPPAAEEVELLLRNARLRDELEPYIDESFELVGSRRMTLADENEFLESMLAWERAPALPISKWFYPELTLPRPEALDQDDLRELLYQTIDRLFSVHIVLEMTEHLSDRQLYTLIFRDILPSCEKKVELPSNYLHWRCVDEGDVDLWLRFYATEIEREQWLENGGETLPEVQIVPYPRELPQPNEE